MKTLHSIVSVMFAALLSLCCLFTAHAESAGTYLPDDVYPKSLTRIYYCTENGDVRKIEGSTLDALLNGEKSLEQAASESPRYVPSKLQTTVSSNAVHEVPLYPTRYDIK